MLKKLSAMPMSWPSRDIRDIHRAKNLCVNVMFKQAPKADVAAGDQGSCRWWTTAQARERCFGSMEEKQCEGRPCPTNRSLPSTAAWCYCLVTVKRQVRAGTPPQEMDAYE
jgi:hypothetical protein